MLLSTSILCMKTHINLQLQEYQFGYWRYIICILTILSTFIKSHCCDFWVVIGVGCRLGAQWSVCSVGWMVICVECRVGGDRCGVSGGWWSVWSVGCVLCGDLCGASGGWWSVWSVGWMVNGMHFVLTFLHVLSCMAWRKRKDPIEIKYLAKYISFSNDS